jgi:membrane fusion protein (multidrug efflux system)
VSTQEEPRPDDLGFALPAPIAVSKKRIFALVLVVGVALAIAFVVGYVPRHEQQRALVASNVTTESQKPRVQVLAAKPVTSDKALSLPGTVTPLEQTTIYPRATGYVRRWLVDIGDKVEEGQLLAELDIPESDAELGVARAQLTQAEAGLELATANLALAQLNLTRAQNLSQKNLIAKADLDQQQATAVGNQASVSVAKANVEAQRANVKRLADVRSYARVVAPFAGRITERNIDRGALVTAGNSTPLFRIVAIDPVRVLVQVPQDVAPGVNVGLAANVTARGYGARAFPGKVARAAGELDPALRTMNTEIRVANPDGALLPGMYVQASLNLSSPHRVLEIPATALYNDAHGLRVATVEDGKVHFVPIVIERDTGATIQVASGLTGNESIVKVAVASLAEGDLVDVMK